MKTYKSGFLAIQLTNGDHEDDITLTVNLELYVYGTIIDRTFLDVNNVPEVMGLLKEYDIVEEVMQMRQSGFVSYPLVKLNYKTLYQMEPEQFTKIIQDGEN